MSEFGGPVAQGRTGKLAAYFEYDGNTADLDKVEVDYIPFDSPDKITLATFKATVKH